MSHKATMPCRARQARENVPIAAVNAAAAAAKIRLEPVPYDELDHAVKDALLAAMEFDEGLDESDKEGIVRAGVDKRLMNVLPCL
jgi:hypothetical protein